MRHKLKEVLSEELVYEIDTYVGQSGSGICLNKWGSPYVVGIHMLGENQLTNIGNVGVRLSYLKGKQVIEWINHTLVINQEVNNSPITPSNLSVSIEVGKQSLLDVDIDELVLQTNQGGLGALRKIRDRSKQNDAYAQVVLGELYEAKNVVKKDINKAFGLYIKSANQGNAFA